MNRKNILILISILAFIMVIGGISYSYFMYNKNVGEVSLTTGDISIDLSGINGNQSLSSVIPISDYDGMNSNNYFDFTVNSTVDTERIYYEVYLLPDSNNTLDTSYLKTYLTDQSNNEIKRITIFDDLGDSEVENGIVIYKGIVEVNNDGTTKNETKNFRLRLWLDESYNEQTSKTFDFDIYLYAKNVDENYELPYGHNLVRKAILAKQNATTNSCNPIWTDTEDNIAYFSGTNDCVDMNYVWYSGKLWRITSIYPDGTMKLVTSNNLTAISYNDGNQTSYYTNATTNSYSYKWLNEEFYNTLYYPSNFIDSTKEWNATRTNNFTDKPNTTTMVSSKAGLLNSYEVYCAYRCVDNNECTGTNVVASGYINTKSYMWLLNSQSSTSIWSTFNGGRGGFSPSSRFGIRPAIYLKADVEFTGEGTIANPYHIVGDKRTGKVNEKINTRLSGEYIKLKNGNNEKVYRIIDIDNDKAKIISIDYADNGATRVFATSDGASNTIWGSGTTTDVDTWYTYLNNTYYSNLVSTYGQLFASDTYYMGISGNDYRLVVCANTTSGNTKVCDKTTDKGSFNVGLPRYGEMFSVLQINHINNYLSMWLINRSTQTAVAYIYSAGNSGEKEPSNTGAVTPTLYLKSTVKILSGSGTESDPYVVGI